ncbi:hypothetical protein QUW15_02795 [Desulfovibrio piger]|nr:hypothetical protein [Desulfovibrio piger]
MATIPYTRLQTVAPHGQTVQTHYHAAYRRGKAFPFRSHQGCTAVPFLRSGTFPIHDEYSF